MHLDLRQPVAEAAAALVGREVDGEAALQQRAAPALPPGTCGRRCRQPREQDAGRAHVSRLPGKRLRVSASSMPTPSAIAMIDEPPCEMKGRVMPLVGIRCRLDAMLMTACRPKPVSKAGDAEQHEHVVLGDHARQRAQHDEGEAGDQQQADDQAELLARHREDEVECASGSTILTEPSPGPRPVRPPFWNASSARSIW